MTAFKIRVGVPALALGLELVVHAPAFAQRAVQMPSASVAAPASPAESENNFVFGGTFETHLQGDITKRSDQGTKVSAFDDSNIDLYANYSSWLSLYGDVKLERQRDDNDDSYFAKSNAFFRSEGVTMRQLFAAVRPTDDLAVYGGKIHPNFGMAWDAMPGNFYNFASDYEQDERIGFGVEYRLPDSFGLLNGRVSFESYYLDTSVLSNSLLSRPGLYDDTARPRRYTREQLGPSNTGKLDSWTASLRGGRPETGLTYQISYSEQATADPTGKTERDASIGMMYDPGGGDGIPLGRRLGVIPFIEYAQSDNFGNTPDQKERYLLGGLALHYVRWELDVAGGLRRNSHVPGDDGNPTDSLDRQANVSLGYAVTPSLNVGVGVNHVNVSGSGGSWTGGPSLSYETAF